MAVDVRLAYCQVSLTALRPTVDACLGEPLAGTGIDIRMVDNVFQVEYLLLAVQS